MLTNKRTIMNAASARFRQRLVGSSIAAILLLMATLAAAVAWGGPGHIGQLKDDAEDFMPAAVAAVVHACAQ